MTFLPRRCLLLAAALALAGCASPPPAAEVLSLALQATGADRLDTLRYEGAGSAASIGQPQQTGGAWPRVNVQGFTRSVDYRSGALRDEWVLSRIDPWGGGAIPASGTARSEQYLSGELAWNLNGTTVAPNPRLVAERLHQLWVTPHGVLKAAQRHGATAARGEDGGSAFAFAVPGRLSGTVHVGPDGLVRRVESTYPDPVMGDTRAITRYTDWRDAGGGVRFPMRIEQSVAGQPVLALTVSAVQPNAPVSLPVPDAARDTAERVAADAVTPGVWFLAGGSHNSVLIEQADHLILVETPLGDARSQAVIDRVKALVPAKPIRWVVNSHPHFDHAGGLRTAVAEGATIVTHGANVSWLEQTLAQANALRPDAMARAGKPVRFRGVGDRADIGDATRPVELHRIAGGQHHDGMVMVWLPRERLLIQADAFTPLPPNTPPPAVPNVNSVNLIENIERLKLPVDRILPLHGRVVPLAALYEAVGRTPPR